MIVHATPEQARGILGAMRQVAEAGGAEPLRSADRAALEAAYRYVFKEHDGRVDPQGFWLTWERGSEITVDTFGRQWNFWAVVHEPVGTLRRRYGIPSLDPAVDAALALREP